MTVTYIHVLFRAPPVFVVVVFVVLVGAVPGVVFVCPSLFFVVVLFTSFSIFLVLAVCCSHLPVRCVFCAVHFLVLAL